MFIGSVINFLCLFTLIIHDVNETENQVFLEPF